jgi:cardiolipin synthase
MLVDDMGSFWLSQDYLRDLKKNGVSVGRFLPIASFKRFFQMNFRNHRKLVIVDGDLAFTGGLNVGEEYAAPRSKKSKRYWRDTHVALRGGAVGQLEELFLEDWYFAQGEKINLPKKADVSAKKAHKVGGGSFAIQLMPMGPTDDAFVSVLFLLHLLNSAQKRVWIATPYFVPDQSILRALELAVLRGVDVRVIIPQKADSRLVQWASLSYADQLQAKGVKVMLYEAGFMHQKVILLDDHVSAVGTMNLDNRAMYLNFEIMVLVFNEAFGISVKHMLLNDFLSCRFFRVSGGSWPRALRKIRGNAARLLAPLL